MSTIADAMGIAVEVVPFPWVAVVAPLLGLAWLYLESCVSSAMRQVPLWHRPLPGLPVVSEIAFVVIVLAILSLVVWVLLVGLVTANAALDRAGSAPNVLARISSEGALLWQGIMQRANGTFPIGWMARFANKATSAKTLESPRAARDPTANPTGIQQSPSSAKDTPTVRPAPTPLVEFIVGTDAANCRSGPATDQDVKEYVLQGSRMTVLGMAEGGDWYLVCTPAGRNLWIAASVGRITSQPGVEVPLVTAEAP